MSNADFWVFAYGSLMWDPGFVPAETIRGSIKGYHRSFCMHSTRYRGTQSDPGLVLALDKTSPQSTCEGIALRIPNKQLEQILAQLRERELVTNAYEEQFHDIKLHNGRLVKALCYVIRHEHPQYCQDLSFEQKAQIMAKAHGKRGANSDYLFKTADHLKQLAIHDEEIEWLVARVQELQIR